MVVFAMIARLSDGLPLSASTDLDAHERTVESKKNGKMLARKARSLPSKLSMDSGDFVWHVIQNMGVCFMALTEYEYPPVLAFCFLDELQHEFSMSYDDRSVQQAKRPYGFIDFDGFLQKCKQRYLSPQSLHTRVPLTEMSRRLEEAPASRMNAVAILGATAALGSGGSGAGRAAARRSDSDELKSTVQVKILVTLFAALLLLSALYRYHLALELHTVDRLESDMPLMDVIWSVFSVLVGSLCLIQGYMLVLVPSWSTSRQHLVLVPLILLLAALCYFGDWAYALVNLCNASMALGVAELTRSRSTKRRTLKQSA